MQPACPVEILLVEDNPDDVELTLHVFNKFNISNAVHVVGDGAEALDFFFRAGAHEAGERTPRLVLLDLKLPKVSGLEVLRRLKADPRTRKVPIVVLTSSQEDRDLEECYEVGVNSYIVKPVDFTQFGEAARQLGVYWLLLNHPSRPEF